MKIENLLKSLLIHYKYWLCLCVVIVMPIVIFFYFRTNCRNLSLFLFRPSKFIEKSTHAAIEKECISNKGFRESCEYIAGYKENKVMEWREEYTERYKILRNQILYAFLSIVLVLVCSCCLAYVLKIHLTRN